MVVIILFINDNSYHKHYIYPPKCSNISIDVNTFQEIELNIYNFVHVITNTKYYMKFNNLPSGYGLIKLGERTIESIDDQIELNEMINFYYISTNAEIIDNFIIIYNISIQETYSSVCQISLTIKPSSCYISCKFCSKDYTKATDENHYCIECKENYYKLNGTNNCYNRSSLNDSFYLKENIFYPCDENCLTCSDEKTNISNNCLSCDNENKGLYLVEDLYNCEYRNYSGYYLDNDSHMLKRCYNSCKLCNGALEINTDRNEENNHHCIECAENYYKLPKGLYPYNCYDNETINFLKIHICYFTCMNCDEEPIFNNETGNIISHNCKECLGGYNFLFETKDCYNSSILEYGYYLSSKDLMYHKCGNQCQTCINETNCIKCNTKDEYYFIENEESTICYNNETIKEGYYLDKKENPYKWKKCYEKCESCIAEGNYTNMNCLSCNTKLINNKTFKPYYFKLTQNGNCLEGCSGNLFLTSIGDCVSDCPNDTYKYSANHTCLKSCPNNYEINKEENECIIKSFDQTTSSSEFKN